MSGLFWVLAIAGSIVLPVLLWAYRDHRLLADENLKQRRICNNLSKKLEEIESRHHTEIHQRQKSEARLRGYLKLLDTLINTIPNPIYFKDVDGQYRGCNNSFAEDVVGQPRHRIIGARADELMARICPDLAEQIKASEQRLLTAGGAHAFEAVVPCTDRGQREFLFHICSVPAEENKVVGCVGVMLDMTDKNLATRNRVKSEKFKSMLETAGAVCHEMNQPLQAISGYAEILLTKTRPTHHTFKPVKNIKNQADRMADIMRKLQNVTRYETMEYPGGTNIIDLQHSIPPQNSPIPPVHH
jgi:PAS domain-containing protein